MDCKRYEMKYFKLFYWTNCILILTILLPIELCYGHGRLIEPPSRASAWRYGFQNSLPDYNDHELYCGGFTRQWKRNDGKCGICGDAWDLPEPRPHENGGLWGQGLIVRNYQSAAEITIRVELTASHMGYFEFRICPNPDATQECLDQHLLTILSGSPSQPMPSDIETRFYPRNGSRVYEMKAQLPDLKCNQCTLQWRYIAGNNWGLCPNGSGAVGCGPQEEFRSCADISLGEIPHSPIRPMRPTIRKPIHPKDSSNKSDSNGVESSAGTVYSWETILWIIIIIILCASCVWYLQKYHSQSIKNSFLFVRNKVCWGQKTGDNRNSFFSIYFNKLFKNNQTPLNNKKEEPPKPPPRKRNNRIQQDLSSNEHSFNI